MGTTRIGHVQTGKGEMKPLRNRWGDAGGQKVH